MIEVIVVAFTVVLVGFSSCAAISAGVAGERAKPFLSAHRSIQIVWCMGTLCIRPCR